MCEKSWELTRGRVESKRDPRVLIGTLPYQIAHWDCAVGRPLGIGHIAPAATVSVSQSVEKHSKLRTFEMNDFFLSFPMWIFPTWTVF